MSLNQTSEASPPPRALTILVVVMGILIVVGVAVLIATIVSRSLHHVNAPSTQAVRSILTVREGEKVLQVIPEMHGNIVIRVAEPNGDERVEIWSPETGSITSELNIVSSP